MIKSLNCGIVARPQNLLGEGILWLAASNLLLWVDIDGFTLHALCIAKAKETKWTLPVRPTAITKWRDKCVLLLVENGLAKFDIECGVFTHLLQLCDPQKDGIRMNDGITDRFGRFWFGSMDERGGKPFGKLYCLHLDGKVIEVLDEVGISNGLAFAPESDRLYFADSAIGTIFVCEVDMKRCEIRSHRVFADANTAKGVPDGAAIDAEGYLYSCRWDGWGIVRFHPSGRLDAFLELPIQRPTRCAFGGSNGRVLYISSARSGLTNSVLRSQPHAGDILQLYELPVAGAETYSYLGPAPSSLE